MQALFPFLSLSSHIILIHKDLKQFEEGLKCFVNTHFLKTSILSADISFRLYFHLATFNIMLDTLWLALSAATSLLNFNWHSNKLAVSTEIRSLATVLRRTVHKKTEPFFLLRGQRAMLRKTLYWTPKGTLDHVLSINAYCSEMVKMNCISFLFGLIAKQVPNNAFSTYSWLLKLKSVWIILHQWENNNLNITHREMQTGKEDKTFGNLY